MSVQQKSLVLLEPHGKFVVQSRDIPHPGPGEVLVEVHSTALNPVEWKIQAFNLIITEYPAVFGNDAAGVVKKVGEGVTNVVVGDRVYVYGLDLPSPLILTSSVASTKVPLAIAMLRTSSTLLYLLTFWPRYEFWSSRNAQMTNLSLFPDPVSSHFRPSGCPTGRSGNCCSWFLQGTRATFWRFRFDCPLGWRKRQVCGAAHSDHRRSRFGWTTG